MEWTDDGRVADSGKFKANVANAAMRNVMTYLLTSALFAIAFRRRPADNSAAIQPRDHMSIALVYESPSNTSPARIAENGC